MTTNVKLVSISKCLLKPELTPEEFIVYCARVSNPENQTNTQTAPRLIRYLARHAHWSPFEMVDMTFEITTSRYIAHQLIRHRSFSFQEFSQRYSTAPNDTDIVLRKQSTNNRQSSTDVIDNAALDSRVRRVVRECRECYDELLRNDVAREVARAVLPVSTETTLYMKGSVRSWIHYLKLRTDPTTQLEHRRIAQGIQHVFEQHFPNINIQDI